MCPIKLSQIFGLAACAACAACASGTSRTTGEGDGDGDSNVENVALDCSNSLAEYCAMNHCDADLATAKQDTSLCPASLIRCGDYDVILHSSVDTSTNYYYQAGQLVAIDLLVFPNHQTCLGGPAMFDAPQCATTNRPLPACGSPAR